MYEGDPLHYIISSLRFGVAVLLVDLIKLQLLGAVLVSVLVGAVVPVPVVPAHLGSGGVVLPLDVLGVLSDVLLC